MEDYIMKLLTLAITFMLLSSSAYAEQKQFTVTLFDKARSPDNSEIFSYNISATGNDSEISYDQDTVTIDILSKLHFYPGINATEAGMTITLNVKLNSELDAGKCVASFTYTEDNGFQMTNDPVATYTNLTKDSSNFACEAEKVDPIEYRMGIKYDPKN